MQAGKIRNVQALRGIAILLVIFYHLLKIEGKYARFDGVMPDFAAIGAAGVDLFFVISGFVMVIVTGRMSGTPHAAAKFIYRRLARIYPPYWFYTSVVLCVYLAAPSLVNSSQGSEVDILRSYLLAPQDLLPLLNVGWTLVHEIYFYIVFCLILLAFQDRLLIGLLVWAALVVLADISLAGSGNAFLRVYSSPLTLEFIAGCLIALFCQQRSDRPAFPWTACFLAVALLGFGYAGFRFLHGDIVPSGWTRVLLFGLPAAIAVHGVLQLERINASLLPAWLRRIGDASYSIYLSHVLILSALGRIWFVFASDGPGDNLLVLPMMVLCVLAGGFLSWRWIELPALNVTRDYEPRILARLP